MVPSSLIVAQHELARLFRVTARTVRNWHAEGLPRRPDRRYDLRGVLAWYVERQEGDALYHARVRLTREQADRQALQNAARSAQLGERELWAQELASLYDRIRREVGTLVALAPQLSGNVNQRKALLEDVVREILTRLACYRPGSG